MCRRLSLASLFALTLATAPHAQDGASRAVNAFGGCATTTVVFAYATEPPPSQFAYYQAHDCELIYSDHATILLPKLVGATPRTITVRNVGNSPVAVSAHAPDVIDATVLTYSTAASHPWLEPGTAILCCADYYTSIQPQGASTFQAFHGALPNSWFTTSNR